MLISYLFWDSCNPGGGVGGSADLHRCTLEKNRSQFLLCKILEIRTKKNKHD